MLYGAFDYGQKVYQAEPQITFEVTGDVTAETRQHISKGLAHCTHLDWEEIGEGWQVTFDREWEDRFLDFARDCEGIEYHAL